MTIVTGCKLERRAAVLCCILQRISQEIARMSPAINEIFEVGQSLNSRSVTDELNSLSSSFKALTAKAQVTMTTLIH